MQFNKNQITVVILLNLAMLVSAVIGTIKWYGVSGLRWAIFFGAAVVYTVFLYLILKKYYHGLKT